MDYCSRCAGTSNGYKCKQCGEEMNTPNPYHPCGREMVQLRCSACGKAEDFCLCAE